MLQLKRRMGNQAESLEAVSNSGVARDASGQILAGPESAKEAGGAAPPSPGLQPAVVTPTQNVTVSNADPFEIDECGNFSWPVNFSLSSQAARPGYIIQEINSRLDDGTGTVLQSHFWETKWPVSQDQTEVRGRQYCDDVYRARFGCRMASGSHRITGTARFYEMATLPADFILNNPDPQCASATNAFCTTTRPAFWTGTGTAHNVQVTYDCTNRPRVQTTPRTPVQYRRACR